MKTAKRSSAFVFALSLILSAVFAAFVVCAYAEEPDAEVEGLWLKAADFATDAEVIEFDYDKDSGGVIYSRNVDGAVEFTIARLPRKHDKNPVKEPGDVEGALKELVSGMGGDADDIDVDTDAGDFSEKFSHPCVTAEYAVGDGDDERRYAAIYIFTDEWVFWVNLGIPTGSAENYQERAEHWIKYLKFVGED